MDLKPPYILDISEQERMSQIQKNNCLFLWEKETDMLQTIEAILTPFRNKLPLGEMFVVDYWTGKITKLLHNFENEKHLFYIYFSDAGMSTEEKFIVWHKNDVFSLTFFGGDDIKTEKWSYLKR